MVDVRQAQSERDRSILINFKAREYSKHALVIFPFWGHDATSFVIKEQCLTLRELGYEIHALHYNNSNYKVTSDCWDYVYNFKTKNKNFGVWNLHDTGSLNEKNLIDDWVCDELLKFISELNALFNFQICLCQYVFLSSALDVLGERVYKIINSNDIFSGRNTKMLDAGLERKDFYFSTSSEEEFKGLRRADLVLAIQEEEGAYFAKELGAEKVAVLPYVPRKKYLPIKSCNGQLSVGYIASSHAPNLKAILDFCNVLSNEFKIKICIAGSICFSLKDVALPKNVVLEGVVDDVAEFYNKCDVLINPDMLRSGLKVKCVEAFSYGKPLLCTEAASVGIGVREKYHLMENIEEFCLFVKKLVATPSLLVDMALESKRVYDSFAGRYSVYNLFNSCDIAARSKRLANIQKKEVKAMLSPKPKVSVIMPTYGVEKYFEQCLLSVMDQTLQDIEIIPVDDGSPDRCGIIMDEYTKKDTRVKPIHQENGGYGKAINAGLRAATGEYIAIVETDDWIEPDMLEVLYTSAKAGSYSIVKGSFYKHERGRGPYVCSMQHITRGQKEYECSASDLHLVVYESSIWSAIYQRDFLLKNDIWMLETAGAAYQDVVWKFSTYSVSGTILLVDKPVYHYRVMVPGSSSANSAKANAMFVNYEEIRNFLNKHKVFGRMKLGYYAHQFLDLAFHVKRLQGEGLEIFRSKAKNMIAEAESQGITLRQLPLHPDLNDYVHREVFPIWDWVLGKRESLDNPSLPRKSADISMSIGKRVKSKLKRGLIRWVRQPIFAMFLRPVVCEINDEIKKTELSVRGDLLTFGIDLALQNEKLNTLHEKLEVVAQKNREACDELYGTILTGQSNQFAYYLRANRDVVRSKIEKLKYGMDVESCFQVDRYFKLFSLLPSSESISVAYRYPLYMDIFSDEERFILANKDLLFKFLRKSYSNLDMTEVPISFNNMYFECGLRLVPYRLTEKFAGSIALDCGAWVGDSAIPFARYGFKEVHSFEPMPENFEILKRNIKKNSLEKWIKPHNIAIDAKSGVLKFQKIGDDGQGSLATNDGSVRCNSISIDDFCRKIKEPIGLIKLDVEGREFPALQGAVQTIRNHRPVLLVSVYHTWLDPEQIFSAKEFIENLGLGYEFQFKWTQPEESMIYEHQLVCYCNPKG